MEKRNILFVCTANICRSPAAEYLARAQFGQETFRFASSGFLRSDKPSPDELAKTLDKRGIDVRPHRSTQLTKQILIDSDLVLTMESQHIQNIAIDFPDYFAKSLPLVEAASRLEGRLLDVDSFIDELQSRDPMGYLGREWDVDDPFKRGIRHYRKAVTRISGLVDTTLTALGG